MANLDSVVWDIQQTVSQLKENKEDAATIRRALRRLDRSLQNLETELHGMVMNQETQPWTSQESPLSSSLLLESNTPPLVSQSSREGLVPEGLLSDLQALLNQLPLFLRDDDTCELAINLLDHIAHLYTAFDIPITKEQVGNLLHQLVELREQTNTLTNELTHKVTASYLLIVNDTFMKHESVVPVASSAVLNLLGDFLSYSMETIQTERWEFTVITNEYTETKVQWRIATNFLIDYASQLYQQQNSANSFDTVTDWMVVMLRDLRPDDTLPTLSDYVQEFVSNLHKYVVELTDYSLDALDGASLVFSSKSILNNEANDDIDVDGYEIAEVSIQDSLRHLTLATGLLKQMDVWGFTGMALKHLLSLWKTTAKSFIERSGLKTALNYKGDQALHMQLCRHMLELADLVLEQPDTTSTAANYESTLVMTFLRVMEFPELLMNFDAPVWKHLEKALATKSSATRKTIQAAILTLKQQYMLPGTNGKQGDIQAIVDHLIPMLGGETDDPWDGYFQRQLGNCHMECTD